MTTRDDPEFIIRVGLNAVGQFEREHGAFTSDEIAEADAWAAQALDRSRRTGSASQGRSP
jgi:hypothetical protein